MTGSPMDPGPVSRYGACFRRNEGGGVTGGWLRIGGLDSRERGNDGWGVGGGLVGGVGPRLRGGFGGGWGGGMGGEERWETVGVPMGSGPVSRYGACFRRNEGGGVTGGWLRI